MTRAMSHLLNAAGFQAGWWSCVAGVAVGLPWAGLALAAALVVAHLLCDPQPWREVRLAAASLVLGIVVDSLLQHFAVIQFHGWSLGPLSPVWLWMLWVLFALTLNSSLSFLKGWHWSLVAVMGAVFGPISYIVGARLGAATFDGSAQGLSVLALVWALALVALVALAKSSPDGRAAPA